VSVTLWSGGRGVAVPAARRACGRAQGSQRPLKSCDAEPSVGKGEGAGPSRRRDGGADASRRPGGAWWPGAGGRCRRRPPPAHRSSSGGRGRWSVVGARSDCSRIRCTGSWIRSSNDRALTTSEPLPTAPRRGPGAGRAPASPGPWRAPSHGFHGGAWRGEGGPSWPSPCGSAPHPVSPVRRSPAHHGSHASNNRARGLGIEQIDDTTGAVRLHGDSVPVYRRTRM
jgi:hypothetical protein